MEYINKKTGVILKTDSHCEGGDWVLLEELEESREELEEESDKEPKKEPKKPNRNKK